MAKFTNAALFFIASLTAANAFSAVPKTGERLVIHEILWDRSDLARRNAIFGAPVRVM